MPDLEILAEGLQGSFDELAGIAAGINSAAG